MPLFVSLLGRSIRVRRPVVERSVRALRIVKSNPVIDDPFCLETVGDFIQIDGRLFQRPPQPFDKDVVQITAPAIH